MLEAFVLDQIQDTIFDLMRWDEGRFDFEVLPEVLHEDIGLAVSVENIVMEGSRRLEEWQRVRKKVPSMDMVFKMATAPGEGTFEISLKPPSGRSSCSTTATRSYMISPGDARRRLRCCTDGYGLQPGLSRSSMTRGRRARAERERAMPRVAAAGSLRSRSRSPDEFVDEPGGEPAGRSPPAVSTHRARPIWSTRRTGQSPLTSCRHPGVAQRVEPPHGQSLGLGRHLHSRSRLRPRSVLGVERGDRRPRGTASRCGAEASPQTARSVFMAESIGMDEDGVLSRRNQPRISPVQKTHPPEARKASIPCSRVTRRTAARW